LPEPAASSGVADHPRFPLAVLGGGRGVVVDQPVEDFPAHRGAASAVVREPARADDDGAQGQEAANAPTASPSAARV
jgi:hypothetical protein